MDLRSTPERGPDRIRVHLTTRVRCRTREQPDRRRPVARDRSRQPVEHHRGVIDRRGAYRLRRAEIRVGVRHPIRDTVVDDLGYPSRGIDDLAFTPLGVPVRFLGEPRGGRQP